MRDVRVRRQPIQAPIQLEEHVLCKLFGRVAVPGDAIREAEHHRLVLTDDLLERLAITVPGPVEEQVVRRLRRSNRLPHLL